MHRPPAMNELAMFDVPYVIHNPEIIHVKGFGMCMGETVHDKLNVTGPPNVCMKNIVEVSW